MSQCTLQYDNNNIKIVIGDKKKPCLEYKEKALATDLKKFLK
jgi:hypothetical protein